MDPDTFEWMKEHAASMGMSRSEALAIILERIRNQERYATRVDSTYTPTELARYPRRITETEFKQRAAHAKDTRRPLESKPITQHHVVTFPPEPQQESADLPPSGEGRNITLDTTCPHTNKLRHSWGKTCANCGQRL